MLERSRRSVVAAFDDPLPIGLDEAKVFVNDTTEANNSLIENLVAAGFAAAEQVLDRAVLRQTRQWLFNQEPQSPIYLEPYVDATLVVQRAVNGSWQNLTATEFTASGATGEVFPGAEDARTGLGCFPYTIGSWVGAWAYRVEAACGWTPAELPADLRTAILTFVKDLYDHRGIRDIGRPMTKPWYPVMHYSWSQG